MNELLVAPSPSAIPCGVQEFAVEKGIDGYLTAVIELARQAFPSSDLTVSLGQDAEDESHRYIALDVDVGNQAAKQVLAGQRVWSERIIRVCPSHQAVYFVLGWR